ncbi:hypothetical protein BD777DRAFT_129390 [Yarrowia lipolytica]|nr:hypothetical protein BD777DRAFT_129390 [Yarrowia lipolytica]
MSHPLVCRPRMCCAGANHDQPPSMGFFEVQSHRLTDQVYCTLCMFVYTVPCHYRQSWAKMQESTLSCSYPVGQQQKGYAMFFCRCKITCRRRRISNPSGKLILFVPKAGSRSLATLLVPWIVPRTRFYIHLYPNGPNTKSHPHQSSTTN